MMPRRIGPITLMAGICLLAFLTGCSPSDVASATKAPTTVTPTTVTLSQGEGVQDSAVRQEKPTHEIAPEEPNIGMANPAAVNCMEQGGRLDLRTTDDGNQYGVCQFEDGTECEE